MQNFKNFNQIIAIGVGVHQWRGAPSDAHPLVSDGPHERASKLSCHLLFLAFSQTALFIYKYSINYPINMGLCQEEGKIKCIHY